MGPEHGSMRSEILASHIGWLMLGNSWGLSFVSGWKGRTLSALSMLGVTGREANEPMNKTVLGIIKCNCKEML